jgi:hypothetical protein
MADSAPKTMADKSFEDIKWVLDSTDPNEPEQWNDSEIAVFSDYFIEFLQTGKI